jgi:phosphate:Na+ symporter
MTRSVEWILPDREEPSGRKIRLKYIDNKFLNTPVLALSQTNREITRMGEIVNQMLHNIINCFQEEDEKLLEEIKVKDDNVDFLRRSITNYISRIAQESLTQEQSDLEIRYLSVINEIEHVGDIISKNLYPLAIKKARKQFDFSLEGRKEIIEYHSKILKAFEIALSCFSTDNKNLAQQVIQMKPEISKHEHLLRLSHFKRLRNGIKESLETSSVHMDLIDNLKRINSYSVNIAKAVLGDVYPGVKTD